MYSQELLQKCFDEIGKEKRFIPDNFNEPIRMAAKLIQLWHPSENDEPYIVAQNERYEVETAIPLSEWLELEEVKQRN